MADDSARAAFVRTADAPLLPPPANEAGVRGWLVKNLFSSPLNALLTVVFGAFLGYLIWDTVKWASSTRFGRVATARPARVKE